MSANEQEQQRWAGRPRVALGIKALVFIAPIALSALATHLVAQVVPRPPGLLPTILWWLALSVFATGVLFVADRLARKLLPLAALLQLSLVFPDQAPSRFRTAMRTQTVHQLKLRVADIRENGLPDDPALAAETLIELVGDLSAHDRLTRGHAERVRAYSRMIGEELDLDERELDLLQWAGLAHDVGKLFVPGEILNKPGRLTDEEFEVIKQHPGWGAELCEPLRGWLGEWVDAVGEHHERWDGQGYPAGLAGEEISLAARIVSVADVYDVITSARSYKSPSTAVEGRQELARCAGGQFDPRVVRAFMNISLGRLRLIMGPLSWLAQLPVVGRVPVGTATGAAVSATATAVTLVAGGLLDRPGTEQPVVEAAAQEIVVTTVQPTTTVVAPGVVVTLPATTAVPTAPNTSAAPTESTVPATTAAPTTVTPPVDDSTTTIVVTLPPARPAIVISDGRISAVERPTTSPTRPVTTTPPATTPVTTPATTVPPATTTPAATTTTVPPASGPVAVDDAVATSEGSPIVIDVAANDVGAVSASLDTLPANGTVTRVDATRFRFEPDPNWSGVTSFRYTVVDANGARSSASVSISVSAVPDPPIARDDTISMDEDGTVDIPVLANDTDPDGDPLTVVSVNSPDGTVSTDGTTVRFVPESHAWGTMSVSYTISDGTGRTASATVTVTVRARPDDPSAGDDAYATQESTALVVPAPGVLANDGDEDGDTLTASVQSGPGNGTLSLASDGSFTYTPAPAFVGTDTFTYRASDGTGRSDLGTVTIAVGSSGTAQRFYLGTSGTSASNWALTTSKPANASPEPDHDGDGEPGLTIESSSQKLTETDPQKFQHWSVIPASNLVLDGPVRLVLWSTAEDFDDDTDIDYSVWLQDCAANGTGCVTLASTLDVHVDEWNGGSETWVRREITIGSVDATIAAGRMLRLRLMFDHDDVWVALSGTRASSLEYTRAV